jgi:hypothetical protein
VVVWNAAEAVAHDGQLMNYEIAINLMPEKSDHHKTVDRPAIGASPELTMRTEID